MDNLSSILLIKDGLGGDGVPAKNEFRPSDGEPMNQIGLSEMANRSPDLKTFFTAVLPSFQVHSSARLLPSSSPAVVCLRLLLLTAPTPSQCKDAQRHRLSQRPEDE
jgi:hypothetical protein